MKEEEIEKLRRLRATNSKSLVFSFLKFCRTWTKRYLITSQTRVKRVSRIHCSDSHAHFTCTHNNTHALTHYTLTVYLQLLYFLFLSWHYRIRTHFYHHVLLSYFHSHSSASWHTHSPSTLVTPDVGPPWPLRSRRLRSPRRSSRTQPHLVPRQHHRTILRWRMVRWCIRLTRMVRWCIRLTRLTLVCEVIRYRLVQVRQNFKISKKKTCLKCLKIDCVKFWVAPKAPSFCLLLEYCLSYQSSWWGVPIRCLSLRKHCISHLNICISHLNICISHLNICISHLNICISHLNICISHLNKCTTEPDTIHVLQTRWSLIQFLPTLPTDSITALNFSHPKCLLLRLSTKWGLQSMRHRLRADVLEPRASVHPAMCSRLFLCQWLHPLGHWKSKSDVYLERELRPER